MFTLMLVKFTTEFTNSPFNCSITELKVLQCNSGLMLIFASQNKSNIPCLLKHFDIDHCQSLLPSSKNFEAKCPFVQSLS